MSQVRLHWRCSAEAPGAAGAAAGGAAARRGILLETLRCLFFLKLILRDPCEPGGQSCKARGPATWTRISAPL